MDEVTEHNLARQEATAGELKKGCAGYHASCSSLHADFKEANKF